MSVRGFTADEKTAFYGLFTNYCGLGGAGQVRSYVDALCKRHDQQYQEYIARGINPYKYFNEADRELVQNLYKVPLDNRDRIVAYAANFFFSLKEKYATRIIENGNEDIELGNMFNEAITDVNGNIDDNFITPDRPNKRTPPQISPSQQDRINHGLPPRQELLLPDGKSFYNLLATTQWFEDT